MFEAPKPFRAAPTNHAGTEPRETAGAPARRRRGRLLALIRKLIDHGQDLLATMRDRPPLDQLYCIGQNFGTWDAAVIITRIMRGLRTAAALEDRIVNCAAGFGGPRPPDPGVTSTVAREPAPASPALTRRTRVGPAEQAPPLAANRREDLVALLEDWPTPEEIAARVRGQPISIVLTGICHDLGIGYSHRLWWDLLDAIDQHGGNYARFMRAASNRKPVFNLFPFDSTQPLLLSIICSSTPPGIR
jgi:hypothetical protein